MKYSIGMASACSIPVEDREFLLDIKPHEISVVGAFGVDPEDEGDPEDDRAYGQYFIHQLPMAPSGRVYHAYLRSGDSVAVVEGWGVHTTIEEALAFTNSGDVPCRECGGPVDKPYEFDTGDACDDTCAGCQEKMNQWCRDFWDNPELPE